MIPITWTMSQIIGTTIGVMDQWSTVMDTTPPILSQYQHRSHPYLSNPQSCQPIKKWPKFALCTQTLPRWQLKLPDLSMKTTKIPSKYWHPLSSQQMKGLPRGWVYIEDDEAGKCEELRNPSRYGHLPPQLILMQQHLEESLRLNHLKGSSTMLEATSSPSPSLMSTESQIQHDSSKST